MTQFDLERLVVTVPTREALDSLLTRGGAEFSVSQNGSLVYVPSQTRTAERVLAWIDRAGRVDPLDLPLEEYSFARRSPDGTVLRR